ncbi:MAG: reverse transcriptase domain-containing protein, partial [Cyanobacteria bacterium J06614_10]
MGVLRTNVLAYADDIVLLANSQEDLTTLYNILEYRLNQLQLVINKDKSKCMIFKKTKWNEKPLQLEIGNSIFEVVSVYKYLGHMVQENLSDRLDAESRLKSFYGKFNWVIRNFNQTTLEVMLFLFNSFCRPEYGLALWCLEALTTKQIFKTFEVAYSNALKKMLGVPIGSSSHGVAEICNAFLFAHHTSFVQARFFKRIIHSNNEVLKILKPQIRAGYIYQSLAKIFLECYNCDIIDNGVDILKSRLMWVQRNEPRTGRDLDGVF